MKYRYNCSTDKRHTITIESHLISAHWKSAIAYGGAEAYFEIRTAFVGEGADIEIQCKGENFGKIGTVRDKIYRNRYMGSIEIPEDIKPGEKISYEVKLAKQGLVGNSNTIPAYPIPLLVSMKWDKKYAKRGDVVTLHASFERVKENREVLVVIYEYDQDGNHDKITTIPTYLKNRKVDLKWEYEYYEDVDDIPIQNEMKPVGKRYNPPEYFFIVVIDGLRFGNNQESGLLEFKDELRLYYKDSDDTPVTDYTYTILLPDGTKSKGVLDENGQILGEKLPPGKIEIIFEPKNP